MRHWGEDSSEPPEPYILNVLQQCLHPTVESFTVLPPILLHLPICLSFGRVRTFVGQLDQLLHLLPAVVESKLLVLLLRVASLQGKPQKEWGTTLMQS